MELTMDQGVRLVTRGDCEDAKGLCSTYSNAAALDNSICGYT